MEEKKPVTTYLEPYLIQMIDDTGSLNNLSQGEALESILRVFFIKDELMEHLSMNSTLMEHIEQLETRLLHLARMNQMHGEAIESLERKINFLEDNWNSIIASGQLDDLAKETNQILQEVHCLIEDERELGG